MVSWAAGTSVKGSSEAITSPPAAETPRTARSPRRFKPRSRTFPGLPRSLTFQYLASSTRDKWATSVHFILAAVGSAVGLGNILRFPSLCYEYGGFSFLIPYIIAVAFIGLPVLASETMLGQMLQRSAVKAYAHIHPRLWGLGCYVTWGAALIVLYYNVILSWCWIYLVYSFYYPLPWGATAESAGEFFYGQVLHMQPPSDSWVVGNATDVTQGGGLPGRWRMSDGLGPVSWEKVLALFVQWFLCFLCIHKGYRTIQRAIFVIVLLPIVMLIGMLFYGITLSGADVGLKAYVDPSESPGGLFGWGAWVSAASQTFFGLSLSNGVMTAYASHEPRSSKVVKNSWIIVIINFFTCIVSGFGVFALLGHLASVEEVAIDEVAGSGFELAFQTFPASFSGFSGIGCNALSAFFFLTLLLLGITSAMSYLQAVSEIFVDNLVWCRDRVVLVNALICTVGFLVSLVMATKSGYYIVDILDNFTANYVLLLGGAFTVATVGWGYPAQKLMARVKGLTEEDARWLPFLWPWLVKIVTPFILVLLFCYNFFRDVNQPFMNYPLWALFVFGWIPTVIIPALCFGLPSLIVPIKDSMESFHMDTLSRHWRGVTRSNSEPAMKKFLHKVQGTLGVSI